jgi:hypothetical protein
MVPLMYREVSPTLYPAAARSVWATLIYLVDEGKVHSDTAATLDARYRLP